MTLCRATLFAGLLLGAAITCAAPDPSSTVARPPEPLGHQVSALEPAPDDVTAALGAFGPPRELDAPEWVPNRSGARLVRLARGTGGLLAVWASGGVVRAARTGPFLDVLDRPALTVAQVAQANELVSLEVAPRGSGYWILWWRCTPADVPVSCTAQGRRLSASGAFLDEMPVELVETSRVFSPALAVSEQRLLMVWGERNPEPAVQGLFIDVAGEDYAISRLQPLLGWRSEILVAGGADFLLAYGGTEGSVVRRIRNSGEADAPAAEVPRISFPTASLAANPTGFLLSQQAIPNPGSGTRARPVVAWRLAADGRVLDESPVTVSDEMVEQRVTAAAGDANGFFAMWNGQALERPTEYVGQYLTSAGTLPTGLLHLSTGTPNAGFNTAKVLGGAEGFVTFGDVGPGLREYAAVQLAQPNSGIAGPMKPVSLVADSELTPKVVSNGETSIVYWREPKNGDFGWDARVLAVDASAQDRSVPWTAPLPEVAQQEWLSFAVIAQDDGFLAVGLARRHPDLTSTFVALPLDARGVPQWSQQRTWEEQDANFGWQPQNFRLLPFGKQSLLVYWGYTFPQSVYARVLNSDGTWDSAEPNVLASGPYSVEDAAAGEGGALIALRRIGFEFNTPDALDVVRVDTRGRAMGRPLVIDAGVRDAHSVPQARVAYVGDAYVVAGLGADHSPNRFRSARVTQDGQVEPIVIPSEVAVAKQFAYANGRAFSVTVEAEPALESDSLVVLRELLPSKGGVALGPRLEISGPRIGELGNVALIAESTAAQREPTSVLLAASEVPAARESSRVTLRAARICLDAHGCVSVTGGGGAGGSGGGGGSAGSPETTPATSAGTAGRADAGGRANTAPPGAGASAGAAGSAVDRAGSPRSRSGAGSDGRSPGCDCATSRAQPAPSSTYWVPLMAALARLGSRRRRNERQR